MFRGLIELRLNIGALAVSTMESIPVYHYSPGGSALRIYIATRYGELLGECDLDICLVARGIVAGVETRLEYIAALSNRLGVDVIFIDGVEGLGEAGDGVARRLRDLSKKPLGVRLQGLSDKTLESLRTSLDSIDFIVIDYLVPYLVGDASVNAASRLYSLAELLRGYDGIVEVIAYVNSRLKDLDKAIDLASRLSSILHVYVEGGEGVTGGFIEGLLERIKREITYPYIHATTNEATDTSCPNCGTVVALRKNNILLALEHENGHCPRCRAKLLFKGRIRAKTETRIRRLLGLSPQLLDPRFMSILDNYNRILHH